MIYNYLDGIPEVYDTCITGPLSPPTRTSLQVILLSPRDADGEYCLHHLRRGEAELVFLRGHMSCDG